MDKFVKSNDKAKKFKQLSPAKKFRMKIRMAKFRKLQQAKQEYFEHDNRGAHASNPIAQTKRFNKKKRAQMLVTAYLNKSMSQNGDVDARNGTQESSSSNTLVKSAISCSAPLRSAMNFVGKEQATHKTSRNLSSNSHSLSSFNSTTTNTTNSHNMLPNVVKCCCHCACLTGKPTKAVGKLKRKPRRKLSSPYFGEIDRIDTAGIQVTGLEGLRNPNTRLNSSSLSTFVKSDTMKSASSSEFFHFRKNSNLLKFNQIFERNFGSNLSSRLSSSNVFGDYDDDDCDLRQVRSVMRFVDVKHWCACYLVNRISSDIDMIISYQLHSGTFLNLKTKLDKSHNTNLHFDIPLRTIKQIHFRILASFLF